MGGSAGSLRALSTLLSGLPRDLAAAVVAVLHTGTRDISDTVALLAKRCKLPVNEALERAPVLAGQVYIAPGTYHLLIERDRHFSLSADARVRFSRPSIDVLFESAADVYKQALIAVVLTGANEDGALGAARIKALGGAVLVQAPQDAEASCMPQAAIDATTPDWVGPVAAMAPVLAQHVGKLRSQHI